MKNLFIAFIGVVCFSLFSCGNSEVQPGNYNIVGNWKYVSPNGGSITKTWVFEENGLFSFNQMNTNASNITYIGSYETDGSTVTITYDSGKKTNTGAYSSTESQLTLTMDYEDGPTVYTLQ